MTRVGRPRNKSAAEMELHRMIADEEKRLKEMDKERAVIVSRLLLLADIRTRIIGKKDEAE